MLTVGFLAHACSDRISGSFGGLGLSQLEGRNNIKSHCTVGLEAHILFCWVFLRTATDGHGRTDTNGRTRTQTDGHKRTARDGRRRTSRDARTATDGRRRTDRDGRWTETDRHKRTDGRNNPREGRTDGDGRTEMDGRTDGRT